MNWYQTSWNRISISSISFSFGKTIFLGVITNCQCWSFKVALMQYVWLCLQYEKVKYESKNASKPCVTNEWFLILIEIRSVWHTKWFKKYKHPLLSLLSITIRIHLFACCCNVLWSYDIIINCVVGIPEWIPPNGTAFH